MAQNKLYRFEAIKTFPNVLQYPTGMKGNWRHFFGNDKPLVLELACGKGEYAVGLAQIYPQKNFIGVDLKGNRIYVGAKKCLDENIPNVAFLRSQIDKIADYFTQGEVEEIWLTFPDPQLRKSRAKKRLTHPRFLRLYQQILRPGGPIHLKTDSPVLFDFTLDVIDMYGLRLLESVDNVYGQPVISEELKIKTHYEGLDIAGSSRIHYLKFSLPAQPLPSRDAELHRKIMQHEPAI
ncbi:MAG TPA: tRNA (guanosine(46)-N7)-methyltransferase TrmB [Puia sp.]|nr:tRNA (guanosine(46)-N7)-methyltransferase TrmB [Puia sp.]